MLRLDNETIEAFRETPAPRYGRDASGYGKKIPTGYMLYIRGRWRRLYCCCFSNAATCYVVIDKQDYIVDMEVEI